MNKFHKNKLIIVEILLVIIALALSGCSPGGGPVDASKSKNHYYNYFHTRIIYSPLGNCFELGCSEIKYADVETFNPLNSLYASDKYNVYYKKNILFGASPQSFRYLGSTYSLDANSVYWKGEVLASATSQTFKYLGGVYASDANNVYWYDEILPEADPLSFSVVKISISNQTHHYGRDKEAIFCRNKKVTNDIKAFHSIAEKSNEHYFADSKNVYYIGNTGCKLVSSDPKSFHFIKKKDGAESVYAKDSNNVYFNIFNQVIPETDVDTFEVLCSGIGPPHYAIDKNSVYSFGKKIEGAHPDTFVFPESCR